MKHRRSVHECQGDQIGRIFDQWVIAYVLWQVFFFTEVAQMFFNTF
jgi:hypothetical protein